MRTSQTSEADRQQQLPEAPEVQVLRALVAEPEPEVAQAVVDAQPLAAEAPEDDDGESGEQREDARPLPAGLGAADDRGEEEAARHPGGGDPEDGELEVEGPQQVVGEEPREVEAVEGARTRRGSGRGRPRRAPGAGRAARRRRSRGRPPSGSA